MKKTISLVIILLLASGLVSVSAKTTNFVLLRYEMGETDTGINFHGTYNILETSILKGWTIGTKIITREKGFKKINPYIMRRLKGGFQLGVKYTTDSLNKEAIGPSLKFAKIFGSILTIIDAVQYFGLQGDQENTEVWLHASTMRHGWYIGSEVKYLNIQNGTETVKLRPLKTGYKFKNGIAPFVMLQRCWSDRALFSNSILTGIEIRF